MPLQKTSFKTPAELRAALGARLKALRINHDLTQQIVADRAGIALKSLRNLELGAGSSVDTLVRVLKALDATAAIESLAPAATVSPLALLRSPTAPKRASRRPKPARRGAR